ncbi:hypothetical protein PTKIN_Ptkin01aG0003400 [Pterospermum kingtungense]
MLISLGFSKWDIRMLSLSFDSKVVVDALGKDEHVLNKFGSIIVDYNSLFSQANTFKVTHVRRQANEVVYALVRRSRSYSCPLVLFDVPFFILAPMRAICTDDHR